MSLFFAIRSQATVWVRKMKKNTNKCAIWAYFPCVECVSFSYSSLGQNLELTLNSKCFPGSTANILSTFLYSSLCSFVLNISTITFCMQINGNSLWENSFISCNEWNSFCVNFSVWLTTIDIKFFKYIKLHWMSVFVCVEITTEAEHTFLRR